MKNFLIIILLFCSVSPLAQRSIEGIDALVYQIESENDTIEYLHFSSDTSKNNPTLLFLQGSLPKPLILDFASFKHINIPFKHQNFLDDYDIVVISMPHTPLMATKDELNQQFCYITDSTNENSYHPAYIQNNILSTYVNRTHTVIKELNQKSDSKIHLIGHSQGAKVAAVVAAESDLVSSVSLLGFNPFGRFDEMIRGKRNQLNAGKITGEEYTNALDELHSRWKAICRTPEDIESGHHSWVSFSIDYTPYLLKIEVPVFVGFGTKDIIAENCDLLPLKFIEAGKDNYTLKAYPNWDHNFFEVQNGQTNYEKGHWTDVVRDITEWLN